MELVKIKIGDLRPYQNNPRYNDEAVDVVEESIEQVGYITPIIIDENNEILAGETRFRGLDNLAFEEVECVRVSGLNDEQKRKFRLLDNKASEYSKWDLDLLADELNAVDFDGFDFFSKELEKMADKMLKEPKPKKKKLIICPRCGKVVQGLVDMEEFDD